MAKLKASTIERIKTDTKIWVSHPTGKMAGIPAITGSCKNNEFCQKMAKCGKTVCSHCYAQNSLEYEEAARLHYGRNSELLEAETLQEVPKIYSDIARFDTHGDWGNESHAKNELLISRENAGTHFTAWTKRLDVLRKLLNAGTPQPDNYHLKVSSPYTDVYLPQWLKTWAASKGWTISFFTVRSLKSLIAEYGIDYLREHGAEIITCGGRNCRKCMRCYGPHKYEDVTELLKQDVRKAEKLGIPIGGNKHD